MKIKILKDVKIDGVIREKGSIGEVADEVGTILIGGGLAEAPRKSELAALEEAMSDDGEETPSDDSAKNEEPAPSQTKRRKRKEDE